MNYIIIRAKRKTLRLSLRRDGTPIVYAPKRYPKAEIDKFVEKNLPKLQARADKIKEKRLNGLFGDADTPSLLYLGVRYPLIKVTGAFFSFNGKEFRVSPSLEETELLNAYREFLRMRTQKLVTAIAEEYARKNGLSYNDITVKNVYSRFGSCSAKKNLNFTLALAAFDELFIQSVVTHELAHLKHLNHSAEFHAFHRALFPQIDDITLAKRKEYSAILTALCGYKS